MERIAFSAELRGQAPPPEGEPPTTQPRAESVRVQAARGDGAAGGVVTVSYENHVVFTSESTFTEHGTVRLGDDGAVEIETVGEGTLGPSPEPEVLQGAVIWRVTAGQGSFEGASGLITSNFLLSPETGEVEEWQSGVLFVP